MHHLQEHDLPEALLDGPARAHVGEGAAHAVAAERGLYSAAAERLQLQPLAHALLAQAVAHDVAAVHLSGALRQVCLVFGMGREGQQWCSTACTTLADWPRR